MAKITKACKRDCTCTDCKFGTQVEIGQNGEVVTISLSEYEELLSCKQMVDNIYYNLNLKKRNDTEKKDNKD